MIIVGLTVLSMPFKVEKVQAQSIENIKLYEELIKFRNKEIRNKNNVKTVSKQVSIIDASLFKSYFRINSQDSLVTNKGTVQPPNAKCGNGSSIQIQTSHNYGDTAEVWLDVNNLSLEPIEKTILRVLPSNQYAIAPDLDSYPVIYLSKLLYLNNSEEIKNSYNDGDVISGDDTLSRFIIDSDEISDTLLLLAKGCDYFFLYAPIYVHLWNNTLKRSNFGYDNYYQEYQENFSVSDNLIIHPNSSYLISSLGTVTIPTVNGGYKSVLRTLEKHSRHALSPLVGIVCA